MYNYFRAITTFLFFISVNSTYAFKPSVESLFRNGGNGDIELKTVVGNLLIENIGKDSSNDTGSSSESNSLESTSSFAKKLDLPKYTTLKLLFYNENNKRNKLLQLNYLDSNFSESNISNLHFKNNTNLKMLGLNNENVDGQFFYSIMNSLLNNDGSFMIDLLKELGSSIKSNKELINQEKYQLLGKYKNYLEKKIDGVDEKLLKNPLQADDTEEQKRIKEVIKQKFYHDSSYVNHVKEGEKFYWEINDSILSARFSDQERHLKHLKLKTPSGVIEMSFRDYILFNSSHEFPREILFNTTLGNQFKITLKKLSVFEDSKDQLSRRLQRYKKAMSKTNLNQSKHSSKLRLPFLL